MHPQGPGFNDTRTLGGELWRGMGSVRGFQLDSPLVIVDEAQDLDQHRLRMLRAYPLLRRFSQDQGRRPFLCPLPRHCRKGLPGCRTLEEGQLVEFTVVQSVEGAHGRCRPTVGADERQRVCHVLIVK
jgi:hypothetical protein